MKQNEPNPVCLVEEELLPTIPIRYSCQWCGLANVEIDVPSRNLDEDVIQWMNRSVTPGLMKDHEERSPKCRPQKFSNVMIPMEGDDQPIGFNHKKH